MPTALGRLEGRVPRAYAQDYVMPPAARAGASPELSFRTSHGQLLLPTIASAGREGGTNVQPTAQAVGSCTRNNGAPKGALRKYEMVLSPLRGLVFCCADPRLTPWAARSAAPSARIMTSWHTVPFNRGRGRPRLLVSGGACGSPGEGAGAHKITKGC